MKSNFSLTNKTRMRIPRLPFPLIKNDILGKNYTLSLAYVSEKSSQSINKTYRRKDKPADVLSFALGKNMGEIVMCPSQIRRNSAQDDLYPTKNFRESLGYLVIHGMLHLKGMSHSSTMDTAEAKYVKKYFYRNRRRHSIDEGRGRRISKRRKKS